MKVSAATVVSRWSLCIAETPALTPLLPRAVWCVPLCSGETGWGHPSSALLSVWGTPGASLALGGHHCPRAEGGQL